MEYLDLDFDNGSRGNGYCYESWKSNNALAAEESGLATASVLSKKYKISTQDIKDNIESAEWHHTSSWYNQTDYYDPEDIEAFLTTDKGKEALLRYKNRNKALPEIHKNCRVEWLEWGGTRKHPVATERVESNATVSVKGQTATITLKCGTTFKKRLTTNGFSFTPGHVLKELERQDKEARRKHRAKAKNLKDRFNKFITGKRFDVIDYFEYRDQRGSNWQPILQRDLRQLFNDALTRDLTDHHYSERAVTRLEMGEREVVRIGLHHGIRQRK